MGVVLQFGAGFVPKAAQVGEVVFQGGAVGGEVLLVEVFQEKFDHGEGVFHYGQQPASVDGAKDGGFSHGAVDAARSLDDLFSAGEIPFAGGGRCEGERHFCVHASILGF